MTHTGRHKRQIHGRRDAIMPLPSLRLLHGHLWIREIWLGQPIKEGIHIDLLSRQTCEVSYLDVLTLKVTMMALVWVRMSLMKPVLIVCSRIGCIRNRSSSSSRCTPIIRIGLSRRSLSNLAIRVSRSSERNCTPPRWERPGMCAWKAQRGLSSRDGLKGHWVRVGTGLGHSASQGRHDGSRMDEFILQISQLLNAIDADAGVLQFLPEESLDGVELGVDDLVADLGFERGELVCVWRLRR